jgi:2-oxoisovalerate dehydrogenase E1 component beta subunit
MSSSIRDTLQAALRADSGLCIIRETFAGIAGSSEGLEDEFGSDRVRTLPIADRAAVGTAVGMGIAGKRVIVELSSSGRLAAIAEALTEAASIAATGEFPIGLVVRLPYGGQAGNQIDRAAGDLLSAIPNLHVVCPSTPAAACGLLTAAVKARKPIVILEPRELYGRRNNSADDTMDLHKALTRRAGRHVTVATWGSAVGRSLEAAEQLAARSIDAEIIDLVSLCPIDKDSLSESLQKTGRLVVVPPQEDPLSRRILQVGLDQAFLYLESPLRHAQADKQAIADAVVQSFHF